MQAGEIDWDGPTRQVCPECGRSPKDRTCGVTVEPDGRGVAHCFRCGYVETCRGSEVHRRAGPQLARTVSSTKHEVLSDYGRELWGECVGLAGTIGASYLCARACVLPPADGHLRYHPALKHYPSGTAGPALVALVTDAATGQPLTLHRTWILASGEKAPVDPPRMLLGGHRKAGGVVRLWPDEAVTMGLGLAEGIETALSLAHAHTPVWACVDAGNLAAMPVLAGIDSLTVAADHDEAGITAAETCARRWADAGREAYIVTPPGQRMDLNDMARAA
jgi:putative DNA primase/helicase